MPNAKCHVVGGLCSGLLVAHTTIHGTSPIEVGLVTTLLLGSAIGALSPDIDHPESTMGKRLPIFAKITNRLFGHRGFFHSPLNLFLHAFFLMFIGTFLSGTVLAFYTNFVIGWIFGFASHLLLDMLTVSGIPLMSPLSNKPFRLGKFRSGKHDLIISVMAVVCTGFTLYLVI